MENTSVQNVNNKKNIMFIVIAFALAIVVSGLGATLAYLTKNTEKRANLFTFGNVSIELTEEEWKKLPPEEKTIYPEKTIPKDPVIKNIGDNDAYVYMEVKVPMAEVKTYNNNNIIESSNKELFILNLNEDSKWELVKETDELGKTDKDNNYKVYLYVYSDPLSPNDSTLPLFETVQVISIVEGELEMDSIVDIPITAYAIQSEYVTEFKNKNNLSTEDFKNVFDKYIKEKN